MALHFHNNYRKATVLLAVGLSDNSCVSPGVRKRGCCEEAYGKRVK